MISTPKSSWKNSFSQTVLMAMTAGTAVFPSADLNRPIALYDRLTPAPFYDSISSKTCLTKSFKRCPLQSASDKWPESTEKDIVMPTDMLSKAVVMLIGEYGVNRFESFKDYPDGWGGDGHKLSFASVGSMIYFVNSFKGTIHNPSIFMTRSGNLQLGWDTGDNGYVEVEFFSDHIECYAENGDIEKSIPIKKCHEVLTVISQGA